MAAPTPWRGSNPCCRPKALTTPMARSGCRPTRACWAMRSSPSASGLHTAPMARWRPSWPRSTTPLVSATATCCAARTCAGDKSWWPTRSSTSRPSAPWKAIPLPLHAHRRPHGRPHRPARRPGPFAETSISGHLEPFTRHSARRAFWGTPLMTLGVVARIHWHALRLFLKRVPSSTSLLRLSASSHDEHHRINHPRHPRPACRCSGLGQAGCSGCSTSCNMVGSTSNGPMAATAAFRPRPSGHDDTPGVRATLRLTQLARVRAHR